MEADKSEITYALFENDSELIISAKSELSEKSDSSKPPSAASAKPYKLEIVWRNVAIMSLIHGLALWGILRLPYIHPLTTWFLIVLLLLGTLGVQAGAHRLWAHKTYKANAGLRLFLSLCHVLALQNDVYEWCRDHRAHHKFSDTDGDPHNASRGFFFSHVGWLLVKKHPDVARRGKTIDLSDLKADPIVRFQRQWYIPMVLIFWGLFPALTPIYFWNESTLNSILVCVFFRYVYSVNVTWLTNSWAHIYGHKPYDHRIQPVESTIRHLQLGEGFHNYHHAFPWDYSASELGAWDVFNPCTAAIDFFAYMGWAWDLKKATPAMVDNRTQAYGKHKYHYKKSNSLYEWTTGVVSFCAPIMLVKWTLSQLFAASV